MKKEALRRRISEQVRAFLAKGGKIEVLPTYRVCPYHMQWIARRGMDYTPWTKLGSDDGMELQERLEEGCYRTKPAPVGG
jgi:hypothetical protein